MFLFAISLINIFIHAPAKPATHHFPDSTIIAELHSANSNKTTDLLTLRKIIISGNAITIDRVILRELSYRTGDTIQRADLDKIVDMDKNKLINTRLFTQVDIKTVEAEAHGVDMLITVCERWYTFPAPIFELSDRNLNEWWQNYHHNLSRVNYGIKLIHTNMRGRGERLGLWAQFGFQRELELKYRFPSFDQKQKQGLTVNAYFSEAKNLAYRTEDHKLLFLSSPNVLRTSRGGAISYLYRKSFYNVHMVSAAYRSNTICDSVLAFNPNYYGHERTTQRILTLSYGFSSDHRDYVGYPLNGYHITFDVHKSGIGKESDLDKFEITGSYAKYFPLQRNFYLSTYTTGYWSTHQNVPYSNYETIGYQSQVVRGYEVYVMEGPVSIVNKTTFKKLLLSRKYHCKLMPADQFRYIPFSVYLKSFADVGYVKNYPNYFSNHRLTDKPVYSFGCGVDLVGFYDIVVRLEYSFNGEGKQGFIVNLKREF